MKFKNLFTTTLILATTTALSVFIYANVIEKIAHVDLPFINSIAKTNIPSHINQVTNLKTTFSDSDKYGLYGKPLTLRVPRLNYSTSLNEVAKQKTGWLAENGTASYQIYAKSQGGHFGNTLIFGLPGDKAFNFTELLVENDRIVVQTSKNWKYYYQVSRIRVNPLNSDYVVANNNLSEIVFVKETYDHQLLVVEATFLNMEDLSA